MRLESLLIHRISRAVNASPTIIKIFSSSRQPEWFLIYLRVWSDSYTNVVSLMMSSTETAYFILCQYILWRQSGKKQDGLYQGALISTCKYSCKCNISRIVVVKTPKSDITLISGIFVK